MEFETLTFDVDGVRTVVKSIGSGPPCWHCMAQPPSKGISGRGVWLIASESTCPSTQGSGRAMLPPHYTGMQDMIVHNLRLAAALGLDRPHLVGHSMGGWMAAEMAVVAGERFGRLVLNAPAGLNHPDHPGADLATIGPEALPGYLAHNVDVALRYFPGGSHCPPLDEFLAARDKEGAALERILKVHGMGHPNLGRWLSRHPQRNAGHLGQGGPHASGVAGAALGRAHPECPHADCFARWPFRHAGRPGHRDCYRRLPRGIAVGGR